MPSPTDPPTTPQKEDGDDDSVVMGPSTMKREIKKMMIRDKQRDIELEEAKRIALSEKRKRIAAEELVAPTELPLYLELCHKHYTLNLTVQDHSKSTSGRAANADQKIRPNSIKMWTDFEELQLSQWKEVAETRFMEESVFDCRMTVQQTGETFKRFLMGSEVDLHGYHRYAVEAPVANVVNLFYEHLKGIGGSTEMKMVNFENHSNTLTDSTTLEISEKLKGSARRASLLSEQVDVSDADLAPDGDVQKVVKIGREDQVCVKTIVDGDREKATAAFVMEFKPPHKVTLDQITLGLKELEVQDVLKVSQNDSDKKKATFLVAALITQTFSYMVAKGVEYGCVCTGEAYIFLRIPLEDPRTVYYHLSVPKHDVGENGLSRLSDNTLYLTAVGQMLAFTIRALGTNARSPLWTKKWQAKCATWEIDYDTAHDRVKLKDTHSAYKPRRNVPIRSSPIQTRLRSHRGPQRVICSPSTLLARQSRPDDEDDDDDEDYKTNSGGHFDDSYIAPSPTPAHVSGATGKQKANGQSGRQGSQGNQGNQDNQDIQANQESGTVGKREGGEDRSGRDSSPPTGYPSDYYRRPQLSKWDVCLEMNQNLYCTQECILGLSRGGLLDRACPNFSRHPSLPGPGRDVRPPRHAITAEQYLSLMRELLSLPIDYDLGHIGTGSRGVLFKATLPTYHYTVVAKGTIAPYIPHLQREVAIYTALRDLQGVHVPVCLGALDLSPPVEYFEHRVDYFLFLAYAGTKLPRHTVPTAELLAGAEEALRAIHRAGVLHCDSELRNFTWLDGRVMVIDFERSRAVQPPPEHLPGSVEKDREAARGEPVAFTGGGDGAAGSGTAGGKRKRAALREVSGNATVRDPSSAAKGALEDSSPPPAKKKKVDVLLRDVRGLGQRETVDADDFETDVWKVQQDIYAFCPGPAAVVGC